MKYRPPQIQHFAALPEWSVVTPIHGDDDSAGIVDLAFDPIICWQIRAEISEEREHGAFGTHRVLTDVLPVTLEGAADPDGTWAVSEPNGFFYVPCETQFLKREDLLAYWQQHDLAIKSRRERRNGNA